MNGQASAHRIVFAIYPGTCMLDLAGAQTVFWCADRHLRQLGRGGYEIVTASIDGALVTSSEGALIGGASLRQVGMAADTVVVPGSTDIEAALPAAAPLIGWLREHMPPRIASVCTGSFLLAAAGLLDGRRATTHWLKCERLATLHPCVQVETEAVYVRHDPVWTSAGVSTGIDMALAMVEADQGREIADLVARELVVYTRRAGGESQHSELLNLHAGDGAHFDALHRWIVDHVAERDLNVERLAGQASMSPRNFARVYRQKTGRTPAKAVELFRLEAARRLLQQSDRNLDEIAQACGFGDPDRMRASFQRHLGCSPGAYRRRHAS